MQKLVYSDGARIPGLVNFRSTMLEDASWVVPYLESYVSEKLPGVLSGAVRSYPEFPPREDFDPLMQAYARDGAKPG